MRVAVVLADTALVDTGKVAVVAPAGTVMLSGTVAAAELEVKLIAAPPGGALPVRVMVPTELAPPLTVLGATEIV